jgi:uncharacterized membrane protein
VQPSLVYGPGGASTRMFNQLAALPMLALPQRGEMLVQPVHRIQLRLRDLSGQAAAAGAKLPPAYWQLFRWWVALGFAAFMAFLEIFYLMVAKRPPLAG